MVPCHEIGCAGRQVVSLLWRHRRGRGLTGDRLIELSGNPKAASAARWLETEGFITVDHHRRYSTMAVPTRTSEAAPVRFPHAINADDVQPEYTLDPGRLMAAGETIREALVA